jgi:hypothetical protein
MEEKTQSLPKNRGRPKATKYNIVSEYKEKTPSVLIQSGLFSIKQQRIAVQHYEIPTIGETKIYFTGELFNQFDFDVFQAVINLAHQKKNTNFHFRLVEIVNVMNKNNRTEVKDAIHKSIHRLTSARIIIDSKHFKFTGGLVDSYTEDKDDSNLHNIRIAKETLNMFLFSSEYDGNLRERMKSNLTQFYYMFFCSHSGTVYDYNLETMHQLSQSESSLKEFKRMSMNSFNELFRITEEKVNAQLTTGIKGQYKIRLMKQGNPKLQ